MTTATKSLPVPLTKFLIWLTPRRLRAQAIVLAVCLWTVCAIDFATPGMFDRAGNLKFQDFLPFYISAKLIAQHRTNDIYDFHVQQQELQSIAGATRVQVPYLYGPQVALLFVPLAKFSFSTAARIWTALSLAICASCIYSLWSFSSTVHRKSAIILLAAIAYPPLFHLFVRGQISALILACFTAAFLALRAKREWLAGVVLGFLIFKPQFLVGIPLIFLFAGAWEILTGLLLSATAQLVFTRLYFGSAIMQNYFDLFRHPSKWINVAELSLSSIQMHSLRSFWTLLLPWPSAAIVLSVATSIAAIAIAAHMWKSDSPLALRFSALTLAAVLVNPHLFVYDLVVQAPVLLLIVAWALANRDAYLSPALLVLSYLAFVLPLFGPLSRWTHLQLSVIVFAVLLWTLSCFETPGHKLASVKSPDV